MTNQKKRIILIDDHSVVRQGVKNVIAETEDLQVVGEAESFVQLRTLAMQEEFDLVIVDISLKDCNGLDVVKWLKANFPQKPSLVFSMHPEEQYALRSLNAGAAGYLNKDTEPDTLIHAIKEVLGGKNYLTESVAEKLLNAKFDQDKDQMFQSLSDRELQILCLIGIGKGLTEIADQLGISDKTVYTYRSRILDKLNLDSTAQLINYAVKHELVL